MCDIVFEKVLGRAGKLNRTNVYVEAAVRRVLKKGFMRNFSEFAIKNLWRNLSFNKVKFCRSQASLKLSSSSRCLLVKFAKFIGTPFSQSTTARLLLTVAVLFVVKGELGNKTVNYKESGRERTGFRSCRWQISNYVFLKMS